MPERAAAVWLALLRHGQARSPSSGTLGRETPLSPLGRRQAEAVARRVAGEPRFGFLYASPLPRALQTAEAVASAIDLTPRVDERLAEFELGELSLAAAEETPDLEIWRHDHRGADGETISAFGERVASFFDEIATRHAGDRIAIVCHSGTIDAALRWAMGIDPRHPWMHDFELPNASLTELRFWPHGRGAGGAPRYAELVRIGDAVHLGGLVTGL